MKRKQKEDGSYETHVEMIWAHYIGFCCYVRVSRRCLGDATKSSRSWEYIRG